MPGDPYATQPSADRDVRPWYRAYGLQVVLALGLFGAALLIARIQHLPVRDPDDSIVGPSYIRLPLLAVACFLVDVVARALHGGGLAGWRSRVPVIVRERWSAPRVRLVLIGMGSWYLAYVGFRNLKSYVPFVRPHMLDDELLRLDRSLALGHDPATVLHDLMGTGFAAHLMSLTYVAWIVFLTLSLVIALFWTSNIDTACWYVTAVAVNWVLGVSIYYLVPSTGPIYARPELLRGPARDPGDPHRAELAVRPDRHARRSVRDRRPADHRCLRVAPRVGHGHRLAGRDDDRAAARCGSSGGCGSSSCSTSWPRSTWAGTTSSTCSAGWGSGWPRCGSRRGAPATGTGSRASCRPAVRTPTSWPPPVRRTTHGSWPWAGCGPSASGSGRGRRSSRWCGPSAR